MIIRSSIFRKLLLGSALLILVSLLGADLLLTSFTAEREQSLARQQMARTVRLVAPELISNPPASLQKWAEEVDASAGARVTLIDSTGTVLVDSRHDPETMENHATRPEVQEAVAKGEGTAIRRSATMGVDFSYFARAINLPSHRGAVLRLAIPLTQVGSSIAAVQLRILQASAAGALIAFVLAYGIARSFTRRVRRIENYAAELVRADYSGRFAAEGDDELGQVARSLRIMAEHFRGMMDRLAHESSRRDAILGSMVEGVVAVESNLQIIFYNQAFAQAVHARMPPPDGLSLLQVVRDQALQKLLARVIATRQQARERMSLIPADGRTFDVQAAPLSSPGGTGALATLHDITELERLERVRRDFVTNISHELRTPLAAIHGYAETLLDGALEDAEQSRRFLQVIAAQSARISDLASDLLTLSEIETERLPVSTERVSAIEVAEDALHDVARRADERQVLTYLNAADDVYVAGPKGRLQRAIRNLLLNAINYNRPGGEVRVDVRGVDGTARISVTDNGIGIAAQDIPRVFERFYRVDKARSRETGGTGLGLSIVRHTAERLGGSVAVESQLGKGSVFTLILPAA